MGGRLDLSIAPSNWPPAINEARVTPTEPDLEHPIRSLQVQKLNRKCVHCRVVTIHRARQEAAQQYGRVCELPRNSPRWHQPSPLTNIRLMLAISIAKHAKAQPRRISVK
jgi:hypothetical protein